MDNFDYTHHDFGQFPQDFDPSTNFLNEHEHHDKELDSNGSAFEGQSTTLMNDSESMGVFQGLPHHLGNSDVQGLQLQQQGNDDISNKQQIGEGLEGHLDQNQLTEYTSSTSTSTSSKPKPKRKRATGEALEFLKREFERNPNPNGQNRKRISELTGLPEKNVRIWFQNRRAKYRKSDKPSNKSSATDMTTLVSSFEFDKIPLNINPSYYFIDTSSLTVGSWKRLKSGNLRNSSLDQIQNLSNLSPISINNIMANATDLMVLISKKNYEINYFFSAIANSTKILFRIFYPISSVVNCSLSLDATESLESESRNSNSPSKSEDLNGEHSKLAELRLILSKPPKFAVYFSDVVEDASNNQWSICEDFSEGRQVSDAYVGGSNVPHALSGLDESLKFMDSLILDYNSSDNLDSNPPEIQQPMIQELPPTRLTSRSLPFQDEGDILQHDSFIRGDSSSQHFLSPNETFPSIPFESATATIPKTPDFLNSNEMHESGSISGLLFQDQHSNGSGH